MSRLSRDEYESAHRIFNYVEGLIGPYYGKKTLDQAMGFVSENRWIMFPVPGINSLREGTTLPMPNVFVSFNDIIQDNGKGLCNAYTGVTYHNVEAMAAFHSLLIRKRKSTSLLQILSGLDNTWDVEVQHKTKTDCPNSVPRYNTFRSFKPTVSSEKLRKAITDSNKALLQKGDSYPDTGNPVLWSVTIFSVIKSVTVKTFDADIIQAFKLFTQLLLL